MKNRCWFWHDWEKTKWEQFHINNVYDFDHPKEKGYPPLYREVVQKRTCLRCGLTKYKSVKI